uniref:Uncharacterized protein n=1 Tax=Vitis vinifera TaxID=29760 RepID=F6H532_VITVI
MTWRCSPWEKRKSPCLLISVSCRSVHWFSGEACVTVQMLHCVAVQDKAPAASNLVTPINS